MNKARRSRDHDIFFKKPFVRRYPATASARRRLEEERQACEEGHVVGVEVPQSGVEVPAVEVGELEVREEAQDVQVGPVEVGEHEVREEPVVGEEAQDVQIGPVDKSILRSFDTHVASTIWCGRERDVLRCYSHTTKLLEWEYKGRHFMELITQTGLHQLRQTSYASPNRNVICAIIERWHPETNTFHMPFGEMTITLDDVYCLTGLPIIGSSLQNRIENETNVHLIHRLLGVTEEEAAQSMEGLRGGYVKLEWLRSTFSKHAKSKNKKKLEYAVRAYLLYSLGCTLFTDKTGTRVPATYLQFFEDLEVMHTYAWGTAVLAYLYRQLGLSSRAGVKQFSGYLTLLEAWIYEYLPAFRPLHKRDYEMEQPLAQRWDQNTHAGSSINGIKQYREALDALTASDVNWDPYVSFRQHFPRPEVTWYYGCISFMDTVEPYLPDRVLRQFGHVQTIPSDPIDPERVRRGDSAATYKVFFGMIGRYWSTWDSHLLSESRRGRVARPPHQCAQGYEEWYRKVSWPIIQNPIHRAHVAPEVHNAPNDPWAIIEAARDHLGPAMERMQRDDTSISLEYVLPYVRDAYRVLDVVPPRQ